MDPVRGCAMYIVPEVLKTMLLVADPELVTVNRSALLVPFRLATKRVYLPGESADAESGQGGVRSEQGASTNCGTVNTMVLVSLESILRIMPSPRRIILPVGKNPVPVSVMDLPTGLEVAVALVIMGAAVALAIAALTAARVFGPTMPYPVVAGLPEETTRFLACQRCTAFSVSVPKYPETICSG